MSNFRDGFKKKRFGFGNVEESRVIRAEVQEKSRKQRRTEHFAKHRNIEIDNDKKASSKTNASQERQGRLLRWRQEKNLRKKLKEQQKKPVFKVGIVHHKLYSPAFSKPKLKKNVKNVAVATDAPKRITRATEKRLAEKIAKNTLSIKKAEGAKKKKNAVSKPKSFAPQGFQFKPPAGLKSVPLLEQKEVKKPSNEIYNWNLPSTGKRKSSRLNKESPQKSVSKKKDCQTPRESFALPEDCLGLFGRKTAQKIKMKESESKKSQTPQRKSISRKEKFAVTETNGFADELDVLPTKNLRNRSVSAITPKTTKQSENMANDDEVAKKKQVAVVKKKNLGAPRRLRIRKKVVIPEV